MAGDPIPIQWRVKIEYTLEEAVDLMKMYDKYPTQTLIQWRSVRTGKRVSIGYNN